MKNRIPVFFLLGPFAFIFLLIISICSWSSLGAQDLKLVETGRKTSLRGLSVVNEKVIWVSGSRGMVARSIDGGEHFSWNQVQGYENRDFRDVEGFDDQSAIIMAIDTPAIMLKTDDGGETWKKVFEDRRPGMFLDAMAFRDKKGFVVGDPVNGKAFLARTVDGGESWQELDGPELLTGEAFFASSGSNIGFIQSGKEDFGRHTMQELKIAFVSGGMQSRFFMGDSSFKLPLRSGKNSSGANGFSLNSDGKSGVFFGGDFEAPQERDSSMLLFSYKQGKIQVKSPDQLPFGYKSHVVYLDGQHLLACGTSGVDLSSDGGNSWKKLSDKPFHVAGYAPGSDRAVLAGPGGSIALFFKKDLILK